MKHIIWVLIVVIGMVGNFTGLSSAQPQHEEVIVNFVDHASQRSFRRLRKNMASS